jgi:hypothetical protein
MEAALARKPAQDAQAASGRSDAGRLVLLLALAVALRAWQVPHFEIASPDSIAYIAQAWQLEHHPWPEVLRGQNRHPGYPVAVLATARLVRPFTDGPESVVRQRSAQLASALASVLLVVPMFFLGRELFDRQVAFWACVMFQCLPSSSPVLADGLSEGVFLLFASAALWTAVRGLRGRSAWPFALCGVLSGLAYLTRPEGALIAGATGLVLLGCQAVAAWRRSWGRVLVCGAGLTVAFFAVSGPYIAVIGRVTAKPTARAIVQAPKAPAPAAGSRPLLGTLPAARGEGALPRGGRAAWEVGLAMSFGYYYLGVVPLLLGLYWFRDRLTLLPGAWVLLLVCAALVALLWRVAVVLGYASDRHLLLVTLCGMYWAVAGVRELVRRVSARPGVLAGVMLLLAAVGLSRSLVFSHPERTAFRTAGAWLSEHAAPGDVITDPYDWAWYYAGRAFQDRPGSADARGMRYVVLPSPARENSRRPQLARAVQLAAGAPEVYRARSAGRRGQSLEVVIYALPPTP